MASEIADLFSSSQFRRAPVAKRAAVLANVLLILLASTEKTQYGYI